MKRGKGKLSRKLSEVEVTAIMKEVDDSQPELTTVPRRQFGQERRAGGSEHRMGNERQGDEERADEEREMPPDPPLRIDAAEGT